MSAKTATSTKMANASVSIPSFPCHEARKTRRKLMVVVDENATDPD